jgi:WD40 repeat protein
MANMTARVLEWIVLAALVAIMTSLALAQKPQLYVQTGPVSPVNSIAYSSDGRILASGNGDGTIKLWDMMARREIRTLTGHKDAILSVAFSSDGKMLASGSEDRPVKLWDVTTGQALKTLNGHSSRVVAVKFSPDSKIVASWSVELVLWDVTTGQELRKFKGCLACNLPIARGQVSMPLSFSPDGKILAANSEGDLKLLDVATGKKRKSMFADAEAVAFSPDGKVLATTTSRVGDKELIYEIGLYDTVKGKLLHRLTGHTENISGIVFSPDSKMLASTSYDRTVKLWDVATGQELRTLRGRLNMINSIAFSPDGGTLVGGSGFAPGVEGRVLTGGTESVPSNNTIYFWDVATGQVLPQLAASDGKVFSVVVSPDRKLLASARSDTDTTTVSLWDIAKGRKRQTLRFPFWLFSIAFSPDGRIMAGACRDKTAKLWDAATGYVLRSFAGHTDAVFSVAFSPDGRTLATGSADQTIKLWDLATGRELRTLQGHSGEVFTVAFSPDGRLLASGSTDRTCRLWDVTTGTELRIFTGHASYVRAVAFSPDGAMLASREEGVTVVHDDRHTVSSGGVKLLIPDFVQLNRSRIKLGDVAWRPEFRTLEGDADALFAIAFSRDGKRLASNSYGGAVKVWDVSTGQVIRTLGGHAGEVRGVAFGLDENLLLSAEDSSLYLWDIQSNKLLANLITLGDKDNWLVVTRDGLFDGGPEGWNQILWRFSLLTFDYAPVEAFFSDFYYPELLADLFAGRRPKAQQQIENKDRRRPQLKLYRCRM